MEKLEKVVGGWVTNMLQDIRQNRMIIATMCMFLLHYIQFNEKVKITVKVRDHRRMSLIAQRSQ